MKTLHYCLLLVVATVLMASCGYPDHLKTLPKETVAVVSLDLAGMVSKGDLHKLQEADFYKKMQAKMAEKGAESAKETDEFLKNPLNYGINFLEPVYFFAINSEPNMFAGASVALGDAPKFETFILKTLNNDSTTYAIEKGTGYSFISTKDVSLAWNEVALIVYPSSDSASNTVPILQGIFTEKDKDQSVVGQPGFKSFYKNSKDISGWMSSDVLAGVSKLMSAFGGSGSSEELAQSQEQLKGSSLQFHISFLEDEIQAEYIVELNEALEKIYKEEMLRDGSPDKLTNLVRGKDLAVIAGSVNLQSYLTSIQNSPALSGETKETMSSYIAVVQQFIAPFDGDFLVTISDFKTVQYEVTERVPVIVNDTVTASVDTTRLTADASGGLDEKGLEEDYDWSADWDTEYRDTTYMKKVTLPVFLAATTVNDESLGLMLGMILGKNKPKAGKVTKSDLGDGIVVYSTIKDKVILVSNDKQTIEDINAGKFTNGGKSLQSKGTNEHGIYVYANLDLEKYPATVREEVVNKKASEKEKAAMMRFFGMFDHVEAYNNDDYSALVSFKLKPNGNNSLYSIIESLGNAAYESGALN